jgi:hypothetical protein
MFHHAGPILLHPAKGLNGRHERQEDHREPGPAWADSGWCRAVGRSGGGGCGSGTDHGGDLLLRLTLAAETTGGRRRGRPRETTMAGERASCGGRLVVGCSGCYGQ